MKTINKKSARRVFIASTVMFVLFLVTAAFILPSASMAKSAKEIDIQVDVALEKFNKDITGGKEFLASAKGVLVFPSVIKAGIRR
jgi:lipid-binding SYLF domain-containing protein